MRRKHDVGGNSLLDGVDIEARTAGSAGSLCRIGLRDRLALNGIALLRQEVRKKLACWRFMIGGRFDVDELTRKLDGIDCHASSG